MAFADVTENLALETGGNLATLATAMSTLLLVQKNLINITLQILAELRVHSTLLQGGLNIQEDVETLRASYADDVNATAIATGVIDAY